MHPRDAQAYGASRTRPRTFTAVDGARIASVRLGTGRPSIVLLNGAGMDLDGWFKVLPAIAELGTVIAVDRPGAGASDRPLVAQTGDVVVAALRRLLAHADVSPPHVLVAHSFGGLHAERFARDHPDEVAGMVLVEGAAPDEVLAGSPRGRLAGAIDGVSRALDRVRGRRTGLDERDVVDETVRGLRAAPPFPDIPLVVVTGGRRMRFVPPAAFAGHQAAQATRASLSPRGRQVIAATSGHFPQLTEPDVVVDAVRTVVDALPR